MPGPEQSPIPDPFVWLAYAAAVTERIRLATGVLILPQRHPLYVAKEVITAGGAPTLDEAKRLSDLGVARFVVPPSVFAPDELRKGLERIGDEILARL